MYYILGITHYQAHFDRQASPNVLPLPKNDHDVTSLKLAKSWS
jgi:hypothetical protein